MVFSTILFLWIFLPITLSVYFLLPRALKNTWLLIMSLIFYSWGEPKYVTLIVFSIGMNYLAGLFISACKKKKIKKIGLVLSVVFNLALLGYFKYYNFFLDSLLPLLHLHNLKIHTIALPIGISFYTFQALSYVIDLYRERFKVQKNPFKLALYITFFPQLIAGPIVQYSTIEKQLTDRRVTLQTFNLGIKRFIYGLGKKTLIANTLAMPADEIFSLPYTNLEFGIAWLGILCYTMQIYYDFSAYSDMAIGLGKMFGFDFPENFAYPYISGSIKEFWRRWHISLSSWFREYLYIPLGGNRKGEFRTYINLFIVFLATGLWHGANWTFVFWGIFHGMFLIIERIKLGKYLENSSMRIVKHIYCFFIVVIGWVFFRADSLKYALYYIQTMMGVFKGWNDVTVFYYATPWVCVILITAFVLCGPFQKCFLKNEEFFRTSEVRKFECVLLPLIFGASLMVLISDSYNPFIYFRF